jgi:hypothetical protein
MDKIPEKEKETKKYVVHYPCLGNCVPDSLASVYETLITAIPNGIIGDVHITKGESLIQRSRNNALHYFYNETSADYFISIDSDIQILNCLPDNNAFVKLIQLAEEKDGISGGIYSIKSIMSDGTVRPASVPIETDTPIPHDTIVEMENIATGCLCVKRDVIKDMFAKNKSEVYDGDGDMHGKKICGLYNLKYKNMPNGNKKLLSEDWSFCQRAKDSGYSLWADSSIYLLHHGSYAFSCFVPRTDKQKEKIIKQIPKLGE